MSQLHRNLKRWEDQTKLENKRNPYAGQDELTGAYYDQVFPLNDIMCTKCAMKYKDKSFVKNSKLVSRSDLCRFCDTYYEIPAHFLEINILVGRETLKRYSRNDQYDNTQEIRDKARIKQEKKIHELSRKYI